MLPSLMYYCGESYSLSEEWVTTTYKRSDTKAEDAANQQAQHETELGNSCRRVHLLLMRQRWIVHKGRCGHHPHTRYVAVGRAERKYDEHVRDIRVDDWRVRRGTWRGEVTCKEERHEERTRE